MVKFNWNFLAWRNLTPTEWMNQLNFSRLWPEDRSRKSFLEIRVTDSEVNKLVIKFPSPWLSIHKSPPNIIRKSPTVIYDDEFHVDTQLAEHLKGKKAIHQRLVNQKPSQHTSCKIPLSLPMLLSFSLNHFVSCKLLWRHLKASL